MKKPTLLVFASGSAHGGGSGFENLVRTARSGELDADIVGVVSNHEHGGVRERADRLGIPFIHFAKPWDEAGYRRIVHASEVQYVALSGWLKLVAGLDPARTINIHPGPLPEFGGGGMYGHHVHEAVMAAFARGEVTHSAVCMHFVTPEYDRGPVFFRCNVAIRPDDTPESLGRRVLAAEHRWQPKITNLVVHGQIRWDGRAHGSLELPEGYAIERYE